MKIPIGTMYKVNSNSVMLVSEEDVKIHDAFGSDLTQCHADMSDACANILMEV